MDRRSRTLCWVGFVFSSPADAMYGHERQVDVERVLAPDVLPELTNRFHERQALDVADRAADLDEQHVHALGRRADAVLDLVGDVRDDLHGAAEVLAAAFLLDDRQVDFAGGPVVVAGRHHAGEPLVVPEVEVRFRAVVGHVDLAVLVGAHRARIHIYIGVEFLEGDLVAMPFEEASDGRGRQSLAERRDDAACHEDVFHWPRSFGLWHVCAQERTVSTSLRPRSRSSGVSISMVSVVVSTVPILNPCSRARSCSRLSARSSGVGGSAAKRSRNSRR